MSENTGMKVSTKPTSAQLLEVGTTVCEALDAPEKNMGEQKMNDISDNDKRDATVRQDVRLTCLLNRDDPSTSTIVRSPHHYEAFTRVGDPIMMPCAVETTLPRLNNHLPSNRLRTRIDGNRRPRRTS